MLKVQCIQLGPREQVLPLQQSYDSMVWQLSRLIHKGVLLAIQRQQGMARDAQSVGSIRPAWAKGKKLAKGKVGVG